MGRELGYSGEQLQTFVKEEKAEIRQREKEQRERERDLFVCLVGFLTYSSTTRLYRGRAPRQSV